MPKTPIEKLRKTVLAADRFWEMIAQDPKYLSESSTHTDEIFTHIRSPQPAEAITQIDELFVYLQKVSLPYVEHTLEQEGIWGIPNLDTRWSGIVYQIFGKMHPLDQYAPFAKDDPMTHLWHCLKQILNWDGKTFFAQAADVESIRAVLQGKNDNPIRYALREIAPKLASVDVIIPELLTLAIERYIGSYEIKKLLPKAADIATKLLIEHLKNIPEEEAPYSFGFNQIGGLLSGLGEPALHALLAEYAHESSEVIQGNIIRGLGAFENYPDIVLSFMADILANKELKPRYAVLQTLKESAWHKHSTRIAPFIVDQLKDEDFGICILALDIVHWWGYSHDIRHIAQEQIIELAKNEHHPASYFAIAIAGEFNDPNLIPLFLEIFRSNTDWKRRRNAILAMYDTKPHPQIVIDTLWDALPNEDTYMQGEILDWLSNMGVPHAQLIPHYLTLLQTEETLGGLREIARTLVDWLDEDDRIIVTLREEALKYPKFKPILMYFLNGIETPSAQALYTELLQTVEVSLEDDDG